MKKNILIFVICLTFMINLLGCNSFTQTYRKSNEDKNTSIISRKPEWIKNSVIYEVNLRQYTPEGTIKAFEPNLARLKDMGIDVLWFMPIYPISQKNRQGSLGSYYSVKDYKAVNPEFGTIEDFKELVSKCHKMGFKVILDWVANHTGWDNQWINNKDWYTQNSNGEIISPAGTGWNDVADLNYDNKDMRNAMLDAMKFWVSQIGIDGYRCDYASGVPLDFWENARDELDKIKPVYMIAEDDKNYDFLNKAFNCNYGWNLYNTMNKIAQGNNDAQSVISCQETIDQMYPKGTYTMNFTSNHDENSWNGTEYERLGDAVKTMDALTFLLPGIPLIYSGQEAGFNRRLEFFDKDSIDWNNLSMTGFYKNMIKLKKDNKALWNGEAGGKIEFLKSSNDNVLAFVREKGDNKVIVIVNLSSKNAKASIQADKHLGKYKNFSDNAEFTLNKQQDFDLSPWEYKIMVK